MARESAQPGGRCGRSAAVGAQTIRGVGRFRFHLATESDKPARARTVWGVRPARLAALVLALIAPASCDFSSPERDAPPQRSELHSYEGRVIRGWLLALERQDYEQAAYYFAPGALIDQGRPFRLRTPAQAIEFNSALPCRADLVRLADEGRRVLAAFRLRAGPGGRCSGVVMVRYTIRKGKFTEWRQLPGASPEPDPPRSASARLGGCPGAAGPRAPCASRRGSPA